VTGAAPPRAPQSSSTYDPTRMMVPRPGLMRWARRRPCDRAIAELLDRAALLSESTSLQGYDIGSPMLNDCCRLHDRPLGSSCLRYVPFVIRPQGSY
jgi:hypothetical protein